MKGDFTRFTFDPKKHYNSVLMQQGRVVLDADWNEQADIQEHIRETEVADVVGRSGASIDFAGFKVEVAPGGQDLILSSGRMYVDGILCELDEDLGFQPDIGEGAPETYLAHLDVWDRHITAVEDDDIREEALGGPDTTTRTKTEWRVKLMPCVLENMSCQEASLKLKDLTNLGDSRLAVRLQPAQKESAKDLCAVLSGTAYRGLENQLYRVEIHEPGEVGKATFKWSRNNGAIAFAIEGNSTDEESGNSEPETEPECYKVKLRQLGWDQELKIHKGDWVEVLGDETELLGVPGTLARVEDIDEADLILTLTADVAKHLDESNPKVRRWDLNESTLEDPLLFEGILTEEPSEDCVWIELENGIEVCFKTGDHYRTGDYWLIPARNTGDIEWPHGENDFVPKFGIQHHNCLLAILNRGQEGTWKLEKDCRKLFPPLADTVILSYAGGDGQEAMPGYKLPAPLQVRVSRGERPVEGAEIAFEILEGQGVLKPAGGSVLTGKDGIAQCICRFEDELESPCLRVRAMLIDVVCPDENGDPSHPSIIFNANASVAEQVAYGPPKKCSQLAGSETVKDAIDGLCCQVSFSCVGGDGQEAMPGQQLASSLQVGVSNGLGSVPGQSIKFEIEDGNGTLSPAQPVKTDLHGVAKCDWTLGSSGTQRVKATLLDESGNPVGLPIYFNANVSVASQVAYDGNLGDTVQAAIDELSENNVLHYVGGDGQEAMPGQQLASSLQVGVSNGLGSVPGQSIKFEIEDGNGTLSPAQPVKTDLHGVAKCDWTLGSSGTQRAKATLLDESSNPVGLPIYFNANVSVASQVAYIPPEECSQLGGSKTVKDAIDNLCKILSVKKSRIVWVHGNSLQVEILKGKITVKRDNTGTVVEVTKKSKANIHFSIPTTQSLNGDLPVAQEALIRFKASSVSIAVSIYDGETEIFVGDAEIPTSKDWETKHIVLSDNQISTGLGISILVEGIDEISQIEVSAAGCKLLSNW